MYRKSNIQKENDSLILEKDHSWCRHYHPLGVRRIIIIGIAFSTEEDIVGVGIRGFNECSF